MIQHLERGAVGERTARAFFSGRRVTGEPPRAGHRDASVSFQSGPGQQLVRSYRSSWAAAHPEWLHCCLRRHGEGTRSRHDRTTRYVASGDIRDHRGQNCTAILAVDAHDDFRHRLYETALRRSVSTEISSSFSAGRRYVYLSGISLGTVIATFSRSAQQAQLTSFFVNPLLTTASGAVTPAEAVPHWLQPLVWINPIRHFSVIARSNMIKGTGFAGLWSNFLVLGVFTLIAGGAQRLAVS